jgi:hypothetical protein
MDAYLTSFVSAICTSRDPRVQFNLRQANFVQEEFICTQDLDSFRPSPRNIFRYVFCYYCLCWPKSTAGRGLLERHHCSERCRLLRKISLHERQRNKTPGKCFSFSTYPYIPLVQYIQFPLPRSHDCVTVFQTLL